MTMTSYQEKGPWLPPRSYLAYKFLCSENLNWSGDNWKWTTGELDNEKTHTKNVNNYLKLLQLLHTIWDKTRVAFWGNLSRFKMVQNFQKVLPHILWNNLIQKICLFWCSCCRIIRWNVPNNYWFPTVIGVDVTGSKVNVLISRRIIPLFI